MTFEFFDFSKATTRSVNKSPSINIAKSGRISFNRALTVLKEITQEKYVMIGFDKKSNKIAIKVLDTNKNEKGEVDVRAIKVNVIEKTNTFYVTATPFFRSIEFDLENGVGSVSVEIDKDGLIIAQPPLQEKLHIEELDGKKEEADKKEEVKKEESKKETDKKEEVKK
ncbi:hypothetical protein NSS82_19110 [Paenibacillus sp. FSL H7-0735]|uniref:hypothetical protein n=1 Tax=Paenibacillus sp. FSL H7-0735 TaxID=2954736 RepID=UPI0030F94302